MKPSILDLRWLTSTRIYKLMKISLELLSTNTRKFDVKVRLRVHRLARQVHLQQAKSKPGGERMKEYPWRQWEAIISSTTVTWLLVLWHVQVGGMAPYKGQRGKNDLLSPISTVHHDRVQVMEIKICLQTMNLCGGT